MIVISRRVNQALVLGDDIIVRIVEIDRDRVRLGVSTPSNTSAGRKSIL